MKAPSRDPSDLCIAHGTEPALEVPEKAKSACTPKRFRHMISFAFLEVSFIGRIVRVGGALDLNVSCNGRATSAQQSHFVRYALVIARLPKEGPVFASMLLKVFLFEPA